VTAESTILLVALLALAAVLAWLYHRFRKTRILVTGYGDELEHRIMAKLIRVFHESHAGIEVVFRQYPYKDYARAVLAEIRRGTGPDVVMMSSIHFSDLVLRGVLEPLNSQFLHSGLDINAFYPQAIDRFFLDGYLYALPRDVAPLCLVYYNRRAFEEAGLPPPRDDWDWDTFAATARKLVKVDATGRVIRWGFIEAWSMVENWVYNAGGTMADDPKQPTRWTLAQDPKSLQGLQFRWDLIHKHKVMPPTSIWLGDDDRVAGEMFAEGKAAMILHGFWKTPRFREIRDFPWDVALLPKDRAGHRNYVLSGSAYGIPRTSRKKQAAWKFVKYISAGEGAMKLAADGLVQPALEKLAQSEAFLDGKDPQNKRILLAAMKQGKYTPLCLNWPEIELMILRELAPAWEGRESVEDALKRLGPMLDKNPPLRVPETGAVTPPSG